MGRHRRPMPARAMAPPDNDHPKFKEATLNEIFKTGFKDAESTKISAPALTLAAEYMRLFTLEAAYYLPRSIHRSAETAKQSVASSGAKGSSVQVDVEHLQANAASIPLDFGV